MEPLVSSVVMSDSALKVGETSTLTITFSEAVNNFDNSDITLANGTLTAVSSADGGVTWTGIFTPTDNIEDTSNVISLGTELTDLTGNAPLAGASTSNYTIDTKEPLVSSVVMSNSALTPGDTSTLTITFSEAVNNFGNSDITFENGTLSAVSSADGGVTWTGTFTPTDNIEATTNVISVGTTLTDLAGNAPLADNSTSNYTINTILPATENPEPEPEDLPASTDNEADADSISTDQAAAGGSPNTGLAGDLQTDILILGDSDMGTPQAAAGIFSDTGPASPASTTSKPNASKTAILRADDLQTNVLRADNLNTGTLLAERQGPDTPQHDGLRSNRPGNMDDSGKDEMYHFLKDKLASHHVSPDIVFNHQIVLGNQEMWHEMDSVKEQMKTVGKAQELRKVITIGATAGLATVTTAGYLIWAAQGGSLLTGLLPSVPMWNFVDPLQALNPGAAGGPGNKAEWLKKGLRVLRRKA
jgi:hypothetical protein